MFVKLSFNGILKNLLLQSCPFWIIKILVLSCTLSCALRIVTNGDTLRLTLYTWGLKSPRNRGFFVDVFYLFLKYCAYKYGILLQRCIIVNKDFKENSNRNYRFRNISKYVCKYYFKHWQFMDNKQFVKNNILSFLIIDFSWL